MAFDREPLARSVFCLLEVCILSESRATKARRALFERIGWDVSVRDDKRVARAVADDEELDAVYNLNQGGLLDSFMTYLVEIGFMQYLQGLKASVSERFMVPTFVILLTYMTKILMGIEHLYSMPDLLFSDPALMNVIGFNARWMEEGLWRRSHEKRGEGKEPPKPFSAQMVGNFLSSLLIRESTAFFNKAIQCLSAFGVFPCEIVAVVDATDIETTEKCKGAGVVTRNTEKRDRKGQMRVIPITVFGFKAIVAFDLSTQIPIAVVVTKINRSECKFTRRLIEQAQRNLAPGESRVVKVLVDRGFIDGATMWWLDQQGIRFVVPAKHDMLVYKGAREETKGNKGCIQSRTRKITHGHGKNKTVEYLETEVIGIKDLPYWDTYNDPEMAKRRDRRGYSPKRINAVVVRKWDGKDYGPGGNVVYLTNQPVDKPLTVFDDYDCRSLIENVLFREGKQGWALEVIPQKTQRAAVAHVYMTFALVAFTTAYRAWMEEEEREEEEILRTISPMELRADPSLGVRKWRIEMAKRTFEYMIIFFQNVYGIYHMTEFTVLTGRRVKQIPPEIGTIEDIYARFGLTPP